MKFLFVSIIFPVILFAGNIDISLNHHNGHASYIVNSNNTQNLRSKLLFPFTFNAVDIQYNHKFHYFSIGLFSSFLATKKETIGKDYDWKDNNLTVYSQSHNSISTYYAFGLKLSKHISKHLNIFSTFQYHILDMQWSDTYQEDYVQHQTQSIKGNTLQFQQKFYHYNFGLDYTYSITKKIFFTSALSFIYAQITTKDIHELRNFYTLQNTQSFGYEAQLHVGYKISKHAKVLLSYKYTTIEDTKTDMDYYNTQSNEKFLSYPSSYNYKDTVFGIHYSYNFYSI